MLRPAVVLFLLIAIGATFPAQGKPASAPKQRIAEQDSRSQREKPAASQDEIKPSPNVTVVVKQENTPNDQAANADSAENIAIQRRLARFTLYLVIVGFIQAAILGFTVWAVREQTKANQTMERAWVLVDVQNDPSDGRDKTSVYLGSGTSGDSTGVFVSLSYQNEGRTPAYTYETIAKFRIVENLPPKPDFSVQDGDFIEYEPLILGVGQAHPHTKAVPWMATTEGRGGNGKLSVIYGVVRYFDIFNKKREARFGYRISLDRKLVRLTSREYNKQT